MKAIVERWQDFWFSPTPASTIAVLRIVHGFIVLLWAGAIAPDVLTFFSEDGVLADQAVTGYRWGLLELFPQRGAAIALLIVLFIAGFCLMIGFRSKLAAFVVFVALISFARRNPWVFNAGDSLLRHMALFLAFSHCGAALSVDAMRKDPEAFWRFPSRAPWAQRLIQIQVSILYLFTVWAKARGERWIGGTAVSESLRVDDLTRFDLPYSLTESLIVANLLTFGTIAVELALAILIWNRKLRPFVIALGIALHLFIEISFALGFFSMVIITSYISFVPEESMARFLMRVRERWRRSRVGALRRLAQPRTAPSADGLEPARP